MYEILYEIFFEYHAKFSSYAVITEKIIFQKSGFIIIIL